MFQYVVDWYLNVNLILDWSVRTAIKRHLLPYKLLSQVLEILPWLRAFSELGSMLDSH